MMNARTSGATSSAAHIARILDTIKKCDRVVRAYCEVMTNQARADAERLETHCLSNNAVPCTA
jgi:hypothetical protein